MPIMDRTTSRDHPPSPAGPRPQRTRPTSSPVGDGRDPALSPAPPQHAQEARQRMRSSGPRGASFKVGSPSATRKAQLSDALSNLPHHPQSMGGYRHPGYAGMSRPSSALPPVSTNQTAHSSPAHHFMHAPTPVPVLEPKILPMITAPKVADAELQKAIDQYASMVNEQANSWNSAQSQHVSVQSASGDKSSRRSQARGPRPNPNVQGGSSHTRRDSVSHHDRAPANKENAEQAQYKGVDGGLGFGSSVPMPHAPMSKEMTNLLMLSEPEKRDKKHRPSAHDIGSPNLQKRATLSSMLGSPVPMSPPVTSIIGSPAVGEFKGWFSNLFHWKVQSYALYSMDDVTTTRNEVRRLLQSLGVSVLEDFQWGILKCRAEDIYEGTLQIQKACRFRVEVTPAASFAHNAMMSPQMGLPAARSRSTFAPGYDTAMVLVLEKGSVTTFKAVHARLLADWQLAEALQSPRMSVFGAAATPSLDQRMMA
ncbi:hypothetical protein PHLGIDRAFT_79157 [Phlebiopsis gigantea 11061_1 CR5-6]|uniref:Uncharacterized protein n=1 Tax=Phlebiopsis gigantea (strain 11061_1 CR5-6) TaxID=745531 RepID=A0A0C3RR31_PHLG1|nr:hypothetical protein PHLGIDRAFT_79157 [Phlebiopsis gigantea 11061_1 CR5-6]